MDTTSREPETHGEKSPVPEVGGKPTLSNVEDARNQPWKKIMATMSYGPGTEQLDQDFFDCSEGFYSHSIAA
jgi:hypothetical protein